MNELKSIYTCFTLQTGFLEAFVNEIHDDSAHKAKPKWHNIGALKGAEWGLGFRAHALNPKRENQNPSC